MSNSPSEPGPSPREPDSGDLPTEASDQVGGEPSGSDSLAARIAAAETLEMGQPLGTGDAATPVTAESVDPVIADSVAADSDGAASHGAKASSAATAPGRPSAMRFGLAAMLVITALCAIQFAVISYVGMLPGFISGLALAALVLAILLVVALFVRNRRSPTWDHMETLAIRSTVAIVLLTVAAILAGGGYAVFIQVYAYRQKAFYEGELGYQSVRVRVWERGRRRDAFKVVSVRPGGPSDRAGVVKDEILIISTTMAEFYEIIEMNRGKDIDLTFTTGAETQPLESCPTSQKSVHVPVRR